MKRMCSAGSRRLFALGLIVQLLGSRALADPPLSTLYRFSAFSLKGRISVNSDGAAPLWKALVEVDGALYGTTSKGGANGTGTVFKITTKGAFIMPPRIRTVV